MLKHRLKTIISTRLPLVTGVNQEAMEHFQAWAPSADDEDKRMHTGTPPPSNSGMGQCTDAILAVAMCFWLQLLMKNFSFKVCNKQKSDGKNLQNYTC